MNSRTEDTQTPPGAEGKPVAFCQHCGRPLTKETVRVVGPAVYCEPCLAMRLNGVASGVPPGRAYQPVNPGASPGVPPGFPPGVPPIAAGWGNLSAGRPNPRLAFLLGLIPGVGAMYNEQYAKGIAHLFIFALLVSLSHVSEVFGLLLTGWIFYMAIEAHHTAKARGDGTPLPNPFGLNDIGERLGFAPAAGTRTAGEPFRNATTPPEGFGFEGSGNASAYAPPSSPYASPAEGAAAHTAPEPPISTWGAPVETPGYGSSYDSASAHRTYGPAYPYEQRAPVGYPPPVPPYGAVSAPPDPAPLPVSPASRFPAAAIGLMVLGTVFLLGTTGIFHNVSGRVLVGFGMIGLGAWVFIRRFAGPASIEDRSHEPNYRLRVIRALTPSGWLALIGTLVLLDALRLVRWAYSWPWIIIFAGLLLLLRRVAYNSTVETFAHVDAEPGGASGYGPSATTPVHPLATDLSRDAGTTFRDAR